MKKKGDLADPLEGEEMGVDPVGPFPETKPEEMEFPSIETHIESQSLKCFLTDDERRQAGERMAHALNVKIEAVGTLKSINDQYKAEISKAEAEMAGEATKINSGYEFRVVAVVVSFDHAVGMVRRYRKDTYELIEERRMTDYEAQRKIKF